MKNTHCTECQNKTKLFLKLPGRKNYAYLCQSALKCPYTQPPKSGEITKLTMEEK